MREIKFRAWSGKTMLYLEAGNRIIFAQNNSWLWIFGDNSDHSVLAGSSKDILMQYTGLKDKNGVEIYEGDIVRTWHNFIKFREKTLEECGSENVYKAYQSDEYLEEMHTGDWICEWEVAKFVFNENHEKCMGRYVGGITEHCEVIGNIYQNPELLTNIK